VRFFHCRLRGCEEIGERRISLSNFSGSASEGHRLRMTFALNRDDFQLLDHFADAWDARGDVFGVVGVVEVRDLAAQVGDAVADRDDNREVSGRRVLGESATS